MHDAAQNHRDVDATAGWRVRGRPGQALVFDVTDVVVGAVRNMAFEPVASAVDHGERDVARPGESRR